MIKRLLLSAITILTVFYTFAQETTSQIQGTILTDAKQGLGGATVVALHTPTGTKYSTSTRKDGHYNLPGLRVGGPYTLTVSYVGFKEEKQENITLILGQDFYGDFTMVPDAKELQATVVSAARQNKIFNNSHTGTQEIITRAQLEQLPTVSRSLQDFTRLDPTATSSSGSISFAGTNPGENNITVDGADFNNSFGLSGTLGGQASAQPIALDAIDQIQVNISPYDVRQGGFTGAGVNSVTRQGTNKLRVTVYDFTKGPGTQGYKVEDAVVVKSPFKFNVIGGSVGGAIIPNKLFFFVNAEQDLQNAPATPFIASDANHPVTPGSVSQVSADSLNLLSQYLQNTYKYNPGAYQGYNFKTNSYKVNARIDFNINSANVLTVKYNYLKSYADQPASTSRSLGGNGFITGGQPGNQSMPFQGSGYRINNNLGIWIAELNTRFGNSASNKLQVGYTKERDFRSPQSASGDFPLVDILANGGLSGGNIATTFGYEPFTFNNKLYMDSYQLTDIFSYFKGSHEITIGTQNSYKKYQNAFAPGYQGAYEFTSFNAFLTGQNAVTYGQDYSTLKGGTFPFAYAGATNLSLFAQDKFRVTPTFTLTYGIRVDYTTYQNKFTDNPNFDALTFVNGTTYNVGAAPNGFLVVSPRVGFNWDPTGDRTWQIRGGAGVFEGAPPFVWLENQAANNGVQLGQFTEGGSAGHAPLSIPFFPTAQQGLNYYLTNSGQTQTSTPFSYGVDVTDKKFKYPTELRSSLGVDRKLGDGWVITVEGSYTKMLNATYMLNANLNEQNGFAISNGPDQRQRYLTTTSGSNAYYFKGTSLTQPNLANVIVIKNSSKGWAYYGTFRIQKTIKNFSASIAYAYQDTRTVMENGSTAASLWSARPVANADPNAANLARPSWYQPQRVIANASYKIEYAKHFATVIGVVFEAVPGGATSYTYSGDINGDNNTSNDLIYIPRNASEINLIDAGSYNKTTGAGITSGTAADPRTAAQIWTQLSNFIQQDHYLYHHIGQYAKANSVVYPWWKHMDLHLEEDIFAITKTKRDEDKHTLSIVMDMLNFGNFIDRNWGILKTPVNSSFLRFEGMAADGKTPLISFPYQDPTNLVPQQSSFANSTSISSRWQMQLGVRYTFN